MAGNLPSIANALDVIHGKKPSLAQQNPEGLRSECPAGGHGRVHGLTTTYSKENADKPNNHIAGQRHSADQPAKTGDIAEGFGLDLFGSIKAKARLSRFEMGKMTSKST